MSLIPSVTRACAKSHCVDRGLSLYPPKTCQWEMYNVLSVGHVHIYTDHGANSNTCENISENHQCMGLPHPDRQTVQSPLPGVEIFALVQSRTRRYLVMSPTVRVAPGGSIVGSG